MSKKTFTGMTPADCLIQNNRLHELSPDEKDEYIMALSVKLHDFLTLTCAMETQRESLKPVGALLRKALNK